MDTHRIGSKQPLLILTTAADKLLKVKPGEVLQGQVVDVLPGGEVRLRIMGNLFHARSPLPLPPDTGVLLRVLGMKTGDGPPEIQLQFLQTVAPQETASELPASKNVLLETLSRQLALNLPAGGKPGEGFAATVEKLLKALPDDPAALPRGIRSQLLSLLQTGLRSTGESIRNRLGTLLETSAWQASPEFAELTDSLANLFQDIGRILEVSLKSALENTGVTLETKLMALARRLEAEGDLPLRDPTAALPDGFSPQASHVGLDLKARLLQLRQLLQNQESPQPQTPLAPDALSEKGAAEGKSSSAQTLATVDGLLQDIESFQLLSKLTDSFYTFLPIAWKGLKDGEIAFKRNAAGPGGTSHYCLIRLDFEQLGKLTIVAMLQGRDFFVSFKTDHDGMRTALNGHVQELELMFAEQGLNLKGVNIFSEGESRLEPFERLESFESIVSIKI